MRRHTLCRTVFFILLSVGAAAQTTTVTQPESVRILILPATGDPLTVAPVSNGTGPAFPIAATSTNCNLVPAPAVSGPLTNPKTVQFDDPFHPGRACQVPIPTGLPPGTDYRAVAILTGTCGAAACDSVRSTVAVPPFSITNLSLPPAAATGLRVLP